MSETETSFDLDGMFRQEREEREVRMNLNWRTAMLCGRLRINPHGTDWVHPLTGGVCSDNGAAVRWWMMGDYCAQRDGNGRLDVDVMEARLLERLNKIRDAWAPWPR